MQYFNFKRLVDKYSDEITVIIPSVGEYDDSGDFQKGEPKTLTLRGAVMRHTQKKIYRSAGTITEDDYALYLTENPSIDIVGTTVRYKGSNFTVQSQTENSQFTGVWAFNLKYVSAFKGAAK